MNPNAPSSPLQDIGQALQQAYAHWNAGQVDQAELLCQRVLQAWPGQADALHLLGLMAHAYGNLDLAILHLRQACQAPRAPAAYLSNLAEMCRQRGLLAEAEQAARRAVALDSTLPGAWNNLGIILQESGKLEESRLCLERVLALQPENAEAHNNLGNTCKLLGRYDQAQQHWQQAMALRPTYAEVHSNLANLLNEQGEADRAAELARRAIDLSPRLADAYINLAAVETGRGRHAQAAHWLDALLGFAPDHAGALAARALVLNQLDLPDQALDSARRAAAAAPESAETHYALGTALQSAGAEAEALAAFARAATLPGTAQEKAMVAAAVLHMEAGRQAEAEAGFRQAIAVFPRSASAFHNLADLHRFTAGDPLIGAMEGLLAPGGTQSNTDRMLLHFALGKAYLDLDDSAAGFHHLHEGNRRKRATLDYDAAATERWLAALPAAFPEEALRRLAGSGPASALPVFVLGMPRSGTTLVEQVLASHPLVHGAGELTAMQRLADAAGAQAGALDRLGPEGLARLGEAYLAAVAPLAGGRRHVVDKMPSNFLHIGLFHPALPGARIIHVRRDPVDTCLSCYARLFAQEQAFAYDLAELGRFHRGYQALMAHWRAMLPPDRLLEVDYEAVVADLEAEARRMLDFLGLPWDPAVLDFHRTSRVIRTASVNQVRQPLHGRAVGRWRRHAAEIGPLLEALGVAVP